MLSLLSSLVVTALWSASPSAATPDSATRALADLKQPAGEMVSSIGQKVSLAALAGAKGTVFVFVSIECPLSNGYLPTISRLAKEFADKGIEFVGINPNDGQGLKEIELHRIRYSISMPIVRDPGAHVARSLGITHCPEVVAFAADGKAVYRGRIDDRYPRRGGAPKQVFHSHDLEDVLTQLANGEAITARETEPIGCPVVVARPSQDASKDADVTFSRDVAVILKNRCEECHREGGIGPFALGTYEQAALWADDLVTFTANGSMPPWKLVDGHGDFRNVRRMTAEEIQTIARWVKGGCAPGDSAETPEPTVYTDGWKLGKPDVILEMAEPYTLAAEGPDEYRHFVVPTNFDDDVFVTAIEIYAGNPRVDHHVIVFLDPTGVSERLDAADPTPGYTTSGGWPGFIAPGALGGWAPGNSASFLPEGVARIIPKDSRLVLQMHYHKSGKEESDQTKIGIYLSKEKPKKLLRDIAITPLSALPMLQSLPILSSKIPAGDPKFTVRQTMYLHEDMDFYSVLPHMHLIGREMKVTATLPDGTVKPVVYITNWDFNWQEYYYYDKPLRLPKDTRLDLEAVFDNSADNPANPNSPPKPVAWGEATTDEMAFCFFEVLPTEDAKSADDLTLASVQEFLEGFVEYQIRGPHGPLGKFLPLKKK